MFKSQPSRPTPTGLFNHWKLGRGHNMTSLASSLFQSSDTTAHEVAQTQRWLGIGHDTFLNPCQWCDTSIRNTWIVKDYLCPRNAAMMIARFRQLGPPHLESPVEVVLRPRFTSLSQSQLLTASGMRSGVFPSVIITTLPTSRSLNPEFSLWERRGLFTPVH